MQPKSIILFFYGYILFFRRQMSKISLNKSANLSKDLNLIEKILAMVEIFMNTRIHFGIVVKVENVIIQKVKASFLIVRVMSTLQEREVVL